MAQPALQFDQVSLSFGPVRALDSLSVEVPPGVVAAVAGPDGAGKTSLLRLCLGLLAADSGSVRVLGHEMPADAARVKPIVGYLPQRLGIMVHMTVRENLEYFGALLGVPRRTLRERMAELLDITRLAPFANRQAGHLSGGMKQKLALACAIVHHPRLILLDEPSTGLDPISRRDLWELIYGLLDTGAPGGGDEQGSVLVATPSWEEAERCQWLLVLEAGRAIFAGEPAALRQQAEGRVWEAQVPASQTERLTSLDWVLQASRRGRSLRLVVAPDAPESVGAAIEALVPGARPRLVSPGLADGAALLLRHQAWTEASGP
ncbi:MAG: ABC transporter ATP-binding protein [Armatimonadetes bacterium]|nr:ABC transporter ATP-binding protein [Armatimonadota bacterium]